MLKKILSFLFLFFLMSGAYAQSDTLAELSPRKHKKLLRKKKVNKYIDTIFLDKNNILVGEIKSMEQTILTLKTRYSDKDFKIKWYRVKGIRSNTLFIISLSEGKRLTSTINSIEGTDKVILDSGVNSYEEDIYNIIYLNPVGKSFVSRFKASFDIGFTLTKTNNHRQLTSSAYAGYVANKWNSSGSFNAVMTSQDSIANVRRIDGDLDFQWVLPHDWFLSSTVDFLSNDEQKLLLRTTYRLGGGYYFRHDNSANFGAITGLGYNNENYSEASLPTKKTIEFYFGGGFKKFKIGDLGMDTSLFFSPSISEWGRYRYDFKFDMKYDLPLDFYIKTSFTYNYDNRPVEGASKDDYVLTTSFGWELK
jgi:hypothetical protein